MTPARPRLTDSVAVLTARNVLRYRRIPSLAVLTLVTPIMFVVLFRVVFAGAIHIPGHSYVDFLLPGLLVQTILFGSTQSGVAFAEDRSAGALDQFRSLPIGATAVFAARVLSDTLRNAVTVAVMLAVGVAVGFRSRTSAPSAVAGLAVALLAGAAFSWVAALIGLALNHVESAHDAGFVWVIPLTFASSVFVPVHTLPGWFQPIARANPVTAFVDATRALLIGGHVADRVIWACVWSAGLLAVFAPLSGHRYRQLA
jgi:ABC-2 type transport system permease protein/oleandomycin transport system permease protein